MDERTFLKFFDVAVKTSKFGNYEGQPSLPGSASPPAKPGYLLPWINVIRGAGSFEARRKSPAEANVIRGAGSL